MSYFLMDQLTHEVSEQTLVFVFHNTSKHVLLGRRNDPFGFRKLNGYGGRVEYGQSIKYNAVRNLKQESGLIVQEKDLFEMGYVIFSTDSMKRKVYIFITDRFTKDVILDTPRMKENKWYPQSKLADSDFIRENCMKDGVYWMKMLLGKRPIELEFHIKEFIIEELCKDFAEEKPDLKRPF